MSANSEGAPPSLRREFAVLSTTKKESRRISSSLNAWANDERKPIKRLKKRSSTINPQQKFCQRLPFSGGRLKVSGEDDYWVVSSSNDFSLDAAELAGFPVESHCIKQYRNNVDNDSSFSNIEFALYMKSLNLAHLFGKALVEGEIFEVEGKEYSARIQRSYFGLLLAMESTHLTLVLKNIREFIHDQYEGLKHLVSPIIASAGKVEAQAKNQLTTISRAFAGFLQFTSPLNSVEAEWDIEDKHGLDMEEVHKFLASLLDIYENNQMGSNLFIFSTDDVVYDMFSQFIFEPNGMQKGGSQYDMLNTALSMTTKAHFFLRLRKSPPGLDNTRTSVFLEIPSLEERLHAEVNQRYLDEYRKVSSKYEHIIDGIPASAKESVIDDMDIIAKKISLLESENMSEEHFSRLLEILTSPPSVWNRKLDIYAHEHKLDATWNERILNFEKFLGIPRLTDAVKGQLSVSDIEQILRNVIESAEICERSYKVQMKHMSNQSTIDRLSGGGTLLEDLQSSRRNLRNRAQESSRFIEKAEPSEVKDALLRFQKEMWQELDHFRNIVDDSGADTVQSEGVGALLIGLGQGGQQILRATMANLLNTTSDSRSRNMLDGLGLSSSDIETIDACRNQEKDFSNPTVRNREKLENLFGKKANLLALNLGPELEQLLRQPYSFIWGRAGDNAYKQYNNELIRRPSPNLLLLDPDCQGAGGRMGKGRAYAFTARDYIREALELYKNRSRNVTQIAVIHSFAGGSGSGMILPLLGECKLAYPDADIWVLSAGDEKNGTGAYTPHNVSYITSEVLQSHYNALHHRAEKLTQTNWRGFSNKGRTNLKELYALWEQISRPLGSNFGDLQDRITSSKTSYRRSLEEFNHVGGNSFKAMTGDENSNLSVFESLPLTELEATSYHDGLVGINSDEFFDVWAKWLRVASDPANIWADVAVGGDELSSQESDVRTGLRYKLSYGNLRTLSALLKKRGQVDDVDEFRDILADEQHSGVKEGIKSAALNANLASSSDSETSIDTYEELSDLIAQYAIKMQSYHSRIYNMSERILMNRGVLDDTLIKHVIISNAHLDMAVNFYDGNEPTYEIYNSTMAEVFVNIVHGMVCSEDGSHSDAGGTHEIMDVSDMRRRSKPPMAAVMLNPIATQELSSIVQFKTPQLKDYDRISPYSVFDRFFTKTSSPLYSAESNEQVPIGGDSLKALFTLYFGGNMSHMFNINPRDVIDCYRQTHSDPVWQSYSSDDAAVRNFFSLLVSEGLDVDELESSFSFGVDEAVNMLHWIRLIPVELIKGFLSAEFEPKQVKNFSNLASQWIAVQGRILGYTGQNSILKPETRSAEFSNLIGDVFGMEVMGGHREELAKLLMKLGLLDISHLSAVQSGYLFEPAAYILTPDELIFNEQKISKERVVEFLATPTAYHVAGAARYRKLPDGKRNAVVLPALLADERNYSPKTLLSMWEDGANGPKLLHLKTEAVEWLSRLKLKAAEKSPEFCTLSLFDTLISSSSNPENNSAIREPSETPDFRQSRLIFDRMSLIRPMYLGEPLSLTMMRTSLLGEKYEDSNHQEQALRDSYLGDMSRSQWISNIQSHQEYDFGRNFSPKKFAETLLQRILMFAEVEIGSSTELNEHEIVLRLVQMRMLDILQSDEFERDLNSLRAILDSINNELGGEKPLAELLAEAELEADHHRVNKAAKDIGNFISKLSTALFQAVRQHKFLNHQMRGGEGVSFELTGSVDAFRSKPDEFLTVINTSSGVETSKIKQTINDYFRLYIRPIETAGKTFIQHIKAGPLASMTILMQKTGSIEIAENMKKVYQDLSTRQLSTASKTLVHPYSFLRNVLWMTTFHGQWLNEPTPKYLDALNVPSDVVRKVYGNPALIDQAIESVRQSGDMTAHALPEDDVNRWQSVLDIWSEDESVRNQRMRGVLHIPDMLAINYLRTKYPDNFNDYLTGNEVDSSLEQIYPSTLWQKFFVKKVINEQSVGVNMEVNVVSTDKDDPFATKDPFSSVTSGSDSGVASEEDWLHALGKWSEKFKDAKRVIRKPKESQTSPAAPVIDIQIQDDTKTIDETASEPEQSTPVSTEAPPAPALPEAPPAPALPEAHPAPALPEVLPAPALPEAPPAPALPEVEPKPPLPPSQSPQSLPIEQPPVESDSDDDDDPYSVLWD